MKKVNYFKINRTRLLDGAIRALRRKNFYENGRISINFGDDIGQAESAIDAGGPTREFLRLAINQIVSSSVFAGTETEKFITKCKSGWLV